VSAHLALPLVRGNTSAAVCSRAGLARGTGLGLAPIVEVALADLPPPALEMCVPLSQVAMQPSSVREFGFGRWLIRNAGVVDAEGAPGAPASSARKLRSLCARRAGTPALRIMADTAALRRGAGAAAACQTPLQDRGTEGCCSCGEDRHGTWPYANSLALLVDNGAGLGRQDTCMRRSPSRRDCGAEHSAATANQVRDA
jgi:hypothetical protein